MKLKKKLIPLFYMLPGLIIMGAFVFVPIILSLVMSFFDIKSVGAKWAYAGVNNFKLAFGDSLFFYAFLRTVGFGAFGMATGLFFGLLLSVMVAKHKFLGFYRYIFYLPAVVSMITLGKLWSLMLAPNETGLLNVVAMKFGAKAPINWLGNPSVTYLVVLGIGLIGCGGGMTLILFTTAINNIPKELEEAAKAEGANAVQRAFYITIPMIKPVVSAWAVLSIIGSFKSFEFIFALTGGGPNGTTTTLAILLYNSGRGSNVGYGTSAAMGLALTLIVFVFMSAYLFLSGFRKESDAEV